VGEYNVKYPENHNPLYLPKIGRLKHSKFEGQVNYDPNKEFSTKAAEEYIKLYCGVSPALSFSKQKGREFRSQRNSQTDLNYLKTSVQLVIPSEKEEYGTKDIQSDKREIYDQIWEKTKIKQLEVSVKESMKKINSVFPKKIN